jgi:hypothetical protein
MRSEVFAKIGYSLSTNDLETLKKVCSDEFWMKKRVKTLRKKEKNKINKLKKETIEAIRKHG